ncbi:MAG: hypothetical protein ACYS8Z_21270 [Planctomycetota bacterium]|jgi:hypothetical protein
MKVEPTQPQPKTVKRSKKRFWLAVLLVAFVSVAAYLVRSSGSIHKELAAIEAARAIPDSENAALLYYRILDERPLTLPEGFRGSEPTADPSYGILAPMTKPTDDPDYNAYAPMLQEAGAIKDCRLSLSLAPKVILRRRALCEEIRKWAFLLRKLAQQDQVLGRFDDAFEKYLCMIRMADHCYQQRTREGMYAASLPEDFALGGFSTLIVNGNATESQLAIIDEAVSQLQADWDQAWLQMSRVEKLYAEYWNKQFTLKRRLSWIGINKQLHYNPPPTGPYHAMPKVYARRLFWRRGTRILVALRRYKNNNGRWPQSLEDVASLAPAEVFIHPAKDSKFVYRLKKDTFVLYSENKDGIDEHVWVLSNPTKVPLRPGSTYRELLQAAVSPQHSTVTEPNTHTEQTK